MTEKQILDRLIRLENKAKNNYLKDVPIYEIVKSLSKKDLKEYNKLYSIYLADKGE